MRKYYIVFLLFIAISFVFVQDVPLDVRLIQEDSEIRLEVNYYFPQEFHQIHNPDFFYFSVNEQPGFQWSAIDYPEGVENDGFIEYYGITTLSRTLTITQEATLPDNLTVDIGYQLCDEEGICFIPVKESISTPFLLSDLSTIETAKTSGTQSKWWLYLVMALAGGLLLNLMPCVLPLLSVKAMNLIHQRDKSHRSIFWNSWAYAGGIIASMLLLAALVSILQASGKQLGWGFQFQSPWFLFILISLIFSFALSLFEVFLIQSPIHKRIKSPEGYGGSFFTGIFAVLVATPCTAPFMGTALGFAFSQPAYMIFAIFLTMGLGFSLPFLLLGIMPGIIKKLPKPGNWMILFQEVMGFVLLATALYLLNSLYQQIGSNIVSVLLYLLILSFALWLLGKAQKPVNSKRNKYILLLLALSIALGGGFTVVNLNTFENQSSLDEDIKPFSPELMDRLSQERVFLEFTADWCTTCKINHRNVLDKQEIRDFFREQNIHYVQGDFTLPDETIAQWLQNFGRAGVPAYIYFSPEEDPYIFPELLTKEMLLSTLP